MQDAASLIDIAEKNLERQLGWISTYDARSAFIAGIDVAMAGYLIEQISQTTTCNIFSIMSSVLALGLLLFSLFYIYRGQYPNVNSPNDSVLFFGTISKKYLDVFQNEVSSLTKEKYLNDLNCQIHVNSRILTKKFEFLKISMLGTLVSVIPWLSSLLFV